ncbi:MAG TPA: hypothetical protein VMR33_12765 [Candidatus Baltobacteraceae bacterium]|jgi:hypothetical protein|nr:hypothetical protein [Candidatus Baltobacteraceae bacterium]
MMLVFLAGMPSLLRAAEVGTAPNQLAITAIAAQGTNLFLTASVPPGLKTVALDARSTFNAPWEELQQMTVPEAGGEITFVFPQSDDTARFFRLRASPVLQAPQLVSSESEFVPTPSLSSRLSNGNAVFHFKGRVDGSDKILITHDGALWNHVNWDYPPEPIFINGTQWSPKRINFLTSIAPARFLPESFSLESVDLDLIEARDVVALERTGRGLMVYLNDTPCGSAEYEFTIKFHPVGPKLDEPRPSAVARLKISAQVDGSDCIKITAREAVLEHRIFHLPSDLRVNGIPWDVRQTAVLKNEGATTFLPDGVDFSTARIISRKGRDLATAWGEKDALWVHFADNPNGSDAYEIEIAFGPEQSGPSTPFQIDDRLGRPSL